jgi:ankyrin repeat protein
VETVRVLLEAGVAVDHVNNLGWTALLEAVILGDGSARYADIVRLLIAHHANLNLPDRQGVTALAHAQQRGQRAVSMLLRAAGARP